MSVVDIVGIFAVITLIAILLVRPSGVVGVALALVLVGTGIAVSWHSISQERQQKADTEAFYRREAAAPAIGAPPPDHPRGGS
jgi:hypothetical protein